jgi:chromosome segregation ATPase
MRATTLVLLACAAAVALRPAPASADAATEARLREALRAATTQLRTLEDERASRDAAEASLRKELASARAELAAARRTPAAGRDEAALRQRLAEQADAAAKLAEGLSRCEAQGRHSEDAAHAAAGERAQLEAEATSLTERLAKSEARNARLYRVGKDILDWLSGIGVNGALAAREPFLGLKRVELENVAQEFEDKLLEQKVVKP